MKKAWAAIVFVVIGIGGGALGLHKDDEMSDVERLEMQVAELSISVDELRDENRELSSKLDELELRLTIMEDRFVSRR